FYLRTGKRLPRQVSEVCIQYRPVPHQSSPPPAVGGLEPNRLLLRIHPQEGIVVRFQAKRPGAEMRLATVETRFSYGEAFQAPEPEAYETLLLDVLRGDTTMFMRGDQVEEAWKVVMPILDYWEEQGDSDLATYPAGAWGTTSSHVLLAGSSSFKWSLLDAATEAVEGEGNDRWREGAEPAQQVLETLHRLPGSEAIDAVGHRLVHGGSRFRATVRIDAEARRDLAALAELDPLHTARAIAGIDAAF